MDNACLGMFASELEQVLSSQFTVCMAKFRRNKEKQRLKRKCSVRWEH